MELPYELGEMKSETGEVLRHEVEIMASELAIKLTNLIQEYHSYKEIIEKTGNPKITLYFQRAIKSEIYPIVRRLCVLRWYRRNNIEISESENGITVPSAGIYPLLEKVWPDPTILLKLIKKNSIKQRAGTFYGSLRSITKKSINGFWKIFCRWKYAGRFNNFPIKKGVIAVQYAEGLDIQRRSDLVWYPESQIDPSRILIYFASPDHEPVDKEVIKSIEAMRMQWVCLNIDSVKDKNAPVWYPSFKRNKKVANLNLKPANEIEKWISKTTKELISEINYWFEFYKTFNIRVHFIIGGGDAKYIAQSIALNLNHSKLGVLVGKQRSDLHWPSICMLGFYPVDVMFTWSSRAKKYLSPNVNQIFAGVASGYPNDLVFSQKRISAKEFKNSLGMQDINYTITLFDNSHGPDIHNSTASMERFYLIFLNWLLEDPSVGILIKSKKPSVLQRLPRVLPVLARAEATGRCVRLRNEFGRLPVDASLASNICVGIGISSAVIESAIAGCRGIHCDFTHLRSHEFYEWGYEKIIFDDLDRLISAMKAHKEGNCDYADLGDWTPYINQLDPFRDGHAGKRIGTYLRWCLEGFDVGMNRDEVIQQVNEKYNSLWGADKAVLLSMSHTSIKTRNREM